MKKNKTLALAVVFFALTASAAFANGSPAAIKEKADKANAYLNEMVMPLFNCFAANYNAAKNAPDSATAQSLMGEINKCASVVNVRGLPAPDGEVAGIKARLEGLLQRLSSEINGLVSTLQKYEDIKRKDIKPSVKEGQNTTIMHYGQDPNSVYKDDPLKDAEYEVSKARVKIINLGTDYETAKKDLTVWRENFQAQLKEEAEKYNKAMTK